MYRIAAMLQLDQQLTSPHPAFARPLFRVGNPLTRPASQLSQSALVEHDSISIAITGQRYEACFGDSTSQENYDELVLGSLPAFQV